MGRKKRQKRTPLWRRRFRERSEEEERRATMPFTRLVEVGRVAMVNYGKDYGKLVVIIDISKSPNKKTLIAALNSSKAFEKFAESAWGKKLAAKKAKAASTDFSRFKAMIAKKAKSAKIKAALK